MTVVVKLDAVDFGTWERWRINAFFKGVGQTMELLKELNEMEALK